MAPVWYCAFADVIRPLASQDSTLLSPISARNPRIGMSGPEPAGIMRSIFAAGLLAQLLPLAAYSCGRLKFAESRR